MKHFYPAFYKAFHCIAADCPDSCCQGWDVVIDSESETFYRTVQGELGDKLRSAIYTDADGDRVFRLEDNKKCPFWGTDRLCDIYRNLGEEHLCLTCGRFPRISMEYEGFTEHTLALACPEAARLILTTKDAYADFGAVDAAGCETYPAELMGFLLRSRDEAAAILTADKPLDQRLGDFLRHAEQIQIKLTGDILSEATDPAELFGELEYIDENNRELFVRAARCTPDLSKNDGELENLALYLLYRYLLEAIDTLDVLAAARFTVTSVKTIASLAAENGDIIAAAQRYSKEIEQSYENMERILRR